MRIAIYDQFQKTIVVISYINLGAIVMSNCVEHFVVRHANHSLLVQIHYVMTQVPYMLQISIGLQEADFETSSSVLKKFMQQYCILRSY